ncbi:hypothetical protein EDB81DRAFT_766664 [Dactylonectria macrodidyma]|uniref:3'-5' exonuclease domain-containing protein n=1 Tax=Dactylonectria macrodidyma TaxID=307937 RepID=A0A9P9DKF6_9HYPO|nr:hypothetical protein EDB81DRAFT_766664 [Dactylonectria macrodidyma]
MDDTTSPSILRIAPRPIQDRAPQTPETRKLIVDSPSTLKTLMDDLTGLPRKPPSVFLDADGIDEEESFVLHLFIEPKNTLYSVRVDSPGLGPLAFQPGEYGSVSLRSVLESHLIPKVTFDVRGLSRALFHRYSVELHHVQDLQLMELASREAESKRNLEELLMCIFVSVPEAVTTKQRWLMSTDVKQVELFPWLWRVYHQKLRGPGQHFWLRQARQKANARLVKSRIDDVDDDEQTLGPRMWWDERLKIAAMMEWNNIQKSKMVQLL